MDRVSAGDPHLHLRFRVSRQRPARARRARQAHAGEAAPFCELKELIQSWFWAVAGVKKKVGWADPTHLTDARLSFLLLLTLKRTVNTISIPVQQ